MTDSGAKPCKVIVFAATGDSVDWHFDTLIRGGLENDNEVTLKKESNEDSGENQEKEQIHDSLEPFVYNDLPALRKGYQGNFLSNCNLFKLHGSMQQSERHAVYTGFSRPLESSTSSILICTDVAARGLDLPDVSQVIQYDPPADVRDYIHRIGRTARLGKDGQAFIFLLPSEVEYLDLLEDYKCSVREQPSIELLQALVPLASKPTMKKLKYQAHEIAATDVHMTLERFVQSSKRVSRLINNSNYMVRISCTHKKHFLHLFVRMPRI
jgi:ATP-dependent RNA helicase DDX31/DBP7